ncbi:glycosyltransferase [Aquiluna sp.]|nr:glycosyltransferase [Aquiluna sp.]
MSRNLQKLQRFVTIPFDYPAIELKDSMGTKDHLGKIPANVFQTWETRKLTRRLHRSVSRFRGLNPELSFKLFDAKARDDYMEERWGERDIFAVYKDAKFGPLKADVFRYCILFEQGGFYFDISKGVTRPLREFIEPDSRELLSSEGNLSHREAPKHLVGRLRNHQHLVAQWGFGFAPKHRILELQIQTIENREGAYRNRSFIDPKAAILEFSGPRPFTESVWSFLLESPTHRLNQTDVDFDGSGVYSLPGAAGRYRQSASYVHSPASQILGDEN